MDIPFAELSGIAVCLVFSAFFSGSETALTSLSQVRLLQLLEKYPRYGRALRHWESNHTGMLTTILIGNNISNITASALAADWAAGYFEANGVPIAIGAMTLLLLFSGEITPKALARRYAQTLSPALMYGVLAFHFLVFPVTWVLTSFILLLFKMLGTGAGQGNTVTEEDIEFIVGLGHRSGAIDQEKETLLSSIFEFSDTIAREVMVPRTDVVAIPSEAAYEQVLEIALKSGFSRIPVYEDSIDRILGIFYTKNLIIPPQPEEQGAYLATRLGQAVFVPETKKISEVLKLFQKERIHMAIVVNEFGGTEGIVTMEDIIEELLGEIQDEFDTEEKRLHRNKDGTYTADARLDIDVLEEALGLDFPENRDFESLGGLLMELAGDVPGEGWQEDFQGYTFRVTEADLNRVIRVRIEPARKSERELPAAKGEKPREPEPGEPEQEKPLLQTGSK